MTMFDATATDTGTLRDWQVLNCHESCSGDNLLILLLLLQTLHVGDRFTASGNDNATRDCCAILWVACPEETVRPC
jgi:hypothetical protein